MSASLLENIFVYYFVLFCSLFQIIDEFALDQEIKNRIDKTTNPLNKCRYLANRSFIIGRLKKTLSISLYISNKIHLIDHLIELVFQCRSQIQPERSTVFAERISETAKLPSKLVILREIL